MVDPVCLGLICSRIPNLINFWTNQFTLFLILFYLSKFDSFSFCQKSVFKFRFAKAIKAILGTDMALNQSTFCICNKSPAPCPTIKKSEQIQKSIYIVQPNFLSLPWSSAFLRWPQKFVHFVILRNVCGLLRKTLLYFKPQSKYTVLH